MAPLLSVRGLTKRYAGVAALTEASLEVEAGSVHALVGENGAGKSTLGKIVAGLVRPDAGEVFLGGRLVRFRNPREALSAGIGVVHQELLFCENLSVAENLTLADPPRRGPWIDRAAAIVKARVWLEAVGADIHPEATVSSLSVARQQLVQIAGAIAHGASLLIFDEPTSSLSLVEANRLADLIRDLARSGVSCIYVTHRLDEMFSLCDTATVLRDGRVVGSYTVADLDRDALVTLMVGRHIEKPVARRQAAGEEKLRAEGFAAGSLAIRKGEIVGLAGLVGSGRTELFETLFGLRKLSGGSVLLNGKPHHPRSPEHALRSAIGLVPEDRKRHGLVLGMSARANVSLTVLERIASLGIVRRSLERKLVASFLERLGVRAPSMEAPAGSLSGGNQQKLVLARWLAADCDLLLIDEPTRGVDVGAKAEIHGLLRELADQGKGILFASSDLTEVLALSDRILVLRDGRFVGELDAAQADESKLMRLMAGVT